MASAYCPLVAAKNAANIRYLETLYPPQSLRKKEKSLPIGPSLIMGTRTANLKTSFPDFSLQARANPYGENGVGVGVKREHWPRKKVLRCVQQGI
jgi:hypothetical protein